jgi:cytochrome P450
VYLCFHPDWKAKAKAEVDALVNKHTTNSSDEPLHKRLAAIHIAAWEDEMPILDLVIRETLRISLNMLSLRRNLVEDLTFSGGLVKPGDIVAYSFADVHLNPEIYSRPNEFDPARFAPGREEDKKGTFSYLGWGAGVYSIFLLPHQLIYLTSLRHRASSMHRNESCKTGNQDYSCFHACWFRVRRC